jgi:hypothetical protein
MKPMTPPPAPYCVVASWAVMGAAEQRAARQSWRKRLNMMAVDGWVGCYCLRVVFGLLDIIVVVEQERDSPAVG